MNFWIEFSHFAAVPLTGYRPANDRHFAQARVGWKILAALRAAAHKINTGLVEPLALALRQAQLYRELDRLSDRMLADIGIKRSDIAAVVYGSFPVKAAIKNAAVQGKIVANDQAADQVANTNVAA